MRKEGQLLPGVTWGRGPAGAQGISSGRAAPKDAGLEQAWLSRWGRGVPTPRWDPQAQRPPSHLSLRGSALGSLTWRNQGLEGQGPQGAWFPKAKQRWVL